MQARTPRRAGEVVLIADHGSAEGSRHTLSSAVRYVTGTPPLCLDARHFLPDGRGRLWVRDRRLFLVVPEEGVLVTPAAVLVYEIPPESRTALSGLLDALRRHGLAPGSEAAGWRNATQKDRMVGCFRRDAVPHPETVVLRGADLPAARKAFHRLGGDVWARPSVGMGGRGARRLTRAEQLPDVVAGFARRTWQLSRDAGNRAASGERESLRVVVLDGRPLWAVQHLQPDPDRVTNESAGAVSRRVPEHELPGEVVAAAVAAVGSVGLRFGGADLASTGPAVFEVNVHPLLLPARHLRTVAVPWVRAHLGAQPAVPRHEPSR